MGEGWHVRGRGGQSSVEVLLAVSLVLILFILVNWFVATRQWDVSYIRQEYENQGACSRVSFIISSTYAAKTGAEMLAYTGVGAKIAGNRVHLENYSCGFVGFAEEAELDAGWVRATNRGGEVVIENV